MDNEIYEKYKKAGRIAAKARNFGKEQIKPGVSFLKVAEMVEKTILDSGAGISFPVNISINEIAAHYTPKDNDSLVFKKGDVVKLDVGTHVDGYIADTAVTVEVGSNKYDDMIKASSEALDTAIDIMKPGVDLSDLGASVHEKIKECGYKPIDNLSGHSLERYILHSGISIPSVSDNFSSDIPSVDDVIAIEPFATDGSGHVLQGKGSNIYICKKSIRSRMIRDRQTKIMYHNFLKNFRTLPFAQRWVEKRYKNSDKLLRKLSFFGLIKQYPQLIDAKKGIVTQKEHTVILTENGCEVTT